tara:strand:- start:288 stop:680 length:393 start_codon:yes stop_codon:yes gene_type:complete
MNDTLIDDMIENAINELLSKTARMRRSRMMRTKGKMIARKRAIALRRKASPTQLRIRAMKKARSIISKRILQSRKRSELSLSGREDLEKRLFKKKSIIQRIAKRILPQVRKRESERLAKKRKSTVQKSYS